MATTRLDEEYRAQAAAAKPRPANRPSEDHPRTVRNTPTWHAGPPRPSGRSRSTGRLVVVINRHIVARNRKQGTPIRVSRGRHGKPTYHSVVEFNGPGRLIYDPEHPLPCDARCWLEIEDD